MVSGYGSVGAGPITGRELGGGKEGIESGGWPVLPLVPKRRKGKLHSRAFFESFGGVYAANLLPLIALTVLEGSDERHQAISSCFARAVDRESC